MNGHAEHRNVYTLMHLVDVPMAFDEVNGFTRARAFLGPFGGVTACGLTEQEATDALMKRLHEYMETF